MALLFGKGPEPLQIGRADGLHVQVQPHGGLGRFEHNWTLLNLLPGNPLEPGLQNLYLRVHRRTGIDALPLLTTCQAFAAAGNRFTARGEGLGLTWVCTLTLDPDRNAWLWTVDVRGQGTADLVYAQDIGLGDGFGAGTIDAPPPDSQAAVALAPACRNDAGAAIANTACVLFNSRGISIDEVGAPSAVRVLYLSGPTAVFAVVVSGTSQLQLWRISPGGGTWTQE